MTRTRIGRTAAASSALAAVALLLLVLPGLAGPWQDRLGTLLLPALQSARGLLQRWYTGRQDSCTCPAALRAPGKLEALPIARLTPAADDTISASGAQPLQGLPSQQLGVGVCQLSGMVCDCSCDYASVQAVNMEHLHPLLSQLVKTPFFRYFKASLHCECPLWPEDGMCMLKDCSVCPCEDAEVPEPWRKEDLAACAAGALEAEAAVRRTVDSGMRQQLGSISGWRGLDNPWVPGDDDGVEYSYINLLDNPERYTGYKGEHAHRVWAAIYSQPCFSDLTACKENEVFYRLISGMHSSISAHIANEFLLDEASNAWGPNLSLFQERLGSQDARERIENLYFTYLFVLRAVMKAGPLLGESRFETGCLEQDARTADLVRQLVSNSALRTACPVPFDEGRMWKGADGPKLKQQLQRHFQNITRVMDCVGCEKCKLWGKLQLLGIATSLKVLFSAEDCSAGSAVPPQLVLERNEVIALINLLERLSHSVEVVRNLSSEVQSTPAHLWARPVEQLQHMQLPFSSF